MTARGHSLRCSRSPGSNLYSGLVAPRTYRPRCRRRGRRVAKFHALQVGQSPMGNLYGAFEVKHLFHGILHFLPSFIPVSLFDLESRFFAPTHMGWRPARAGAVKAGRRSALAACSVVSRPRLDSPEHGGRLVVVGMTRPRGARCRGTRNSRRNLVSGGSQ
jgi:hypothetical protein